MDKLHLIRTILGYYVVKLITVTVVCTVTYCMDFMEVNIALYLACAHIKYFGVQSYMNDRRSA